MASCLHSSNGDPQGPGLPKALTVSFYSPQLWGGWASTVYFPPHLQHFRSHVPEGELRGRGLSTSAWNLGPCQLPFSLSAGYWQPWVHTWRSAHPGPLGRCGNLPWVTQLGGNLGSTPLPTPRAQTPSLISHFSPTQQAPAQLPRTRPELSGEYQERGVALTEPMIHSSKFQPVPTEAQCTLP